ncbi:hypothetical protein PG997_013384 [Apiospora hydei]|uniref:Uncharacterized protein n=1 Tax=Apiospora hydei TaxID=1337664 RepID=A0ABR1V6T8_9PEZI
MDRIYELTYLCGCGEGQSTSRSNYERLIKIQRVPFDTAVVNRVCGECRRKPCNFNSWSWKTVAPKDKQRQSQGGYGGKFDELMMFLGELVPQLDSLAVSDLEVVVHRVESRLHIDGFRLFNKHNVIEADRIPEKMKRDITKLVWTQIEQLKQQKKESERARARAAPLAPVMEEEAAGVDARQSRDKRAAVRVVNCKPGKANPISVGGAGFF